MLAFKIRRDSGENLSCLSAGLKAGWHFLSWINYFWNTQFWGESLVKSGKLDPGFTLQKEKF